MKKPSLSAARAAGLLVGLFGAAMAARWMFPLEAIARLVPGAERTGILHPLLFVVAGLCLVVASLPRQAPWLGHLKTACIAVLVVLPAARLLDSIASLAFLLAGIALWLQGRPPTRAGRLGFVVLSLIVCTIGLGALVGHFVGLEMLYPVADFNRMPPATAFGLSAVGAGLWMLHEASCAFDPRAVHESEQRIKRRSIAVLALVTLAGGVAGFAVMRDTFERSVSQDMLLSATTNATSLAHTIDVAAWFAKAVANRPAAREALATLSKAPQDAAARAFLQKVADSFISEDLTGVEIHAADGERVAQAGTMALPQAQVIQRLANVGPAASLAWSNGYLLVADTAVVVDGRTIGRVRTEQRMRLFDELVAHLRAAGDTSDVAICGRDLHKAVCAPNRFRPTGFETPMLDANGRPGLPVTRALLGERGVEVLKDRRGAQVLSAFAPVGTSGLGLAVRTDVDSLYAPLRSRLNILVLVLVGIVALALYAQHSQVRPVLQQLVASQQMVKAIVDDQSELVSLVKPDGELNYVNPAYARYFGHKPADMIGRNMFDFIEPAAHETVRQAVAKVLSTGRTTTGESRLTAADGSTRWISWTDSRQHDRSGAPVLHSVGRDITERKAAERAMRTLTAVFEATTDYVVQNDAQGRVTYMNPAARRRVGLALDAPIDGLTLADFNPPQTLRRFAAEVGPAATRHGVWVGESTVWDAERREFPVSHIVICHLDKRGEVEYFSALMRDISAAKAAEQAVRDSEHRLRMVTDNLPALISYLDRDLRFRFANRTYQQWFGADAPQIGTSVHDLYGEAAWTDIEPRLRAALGGEPVTYDREMEVPAGRRHVQVTVVPDRDAQGSVVGLYTLIADVTSYREAQRALLESEARLRTVADSLPMRVAYVDADERYRFNNLAYERGFGRRREELHGLTVREVLGDAAYRAVEPHIRRALGGEAVTFQSEMASGGSYVCYEAHYIPQFATDGKAVLGFHAVVSDITRQKLEERRLVELARVDPLTGVVNRSGFELRLGGAMERSRASGALMALMYLDIDRFKQVNDRFGHDVGDGLLRGFAARLSQTLRATDTIARLGGDEFTVIMEGLPRPDIASLVGNKIVQAMSAPFVIGPQSIDVTVSIGLAFYQGDATTMEALVKQADVMLYRAKSAGRNNVQTALRLIEGGRA